MNEYKGSTIIFYPRSYNKRGDESLHSMVGMTSEGDLINVKLRLHEKYLQRDNPPSVAEFARNDYRAKMACIATDDNGPDKPEGILLLSKCVKEGRDRTRNLDVYIARWADVIATDSLSPKPIFGLSRINIQDNSTQVKKLRSLAAQSKQKGNLEDAKSYEEQMEDPRNWSYPVITYYPEDLVRVVAGNRDELTEKGAPLVDKYCANGLVGGLAVRCLNSNGQVIKDSYLESHCRIIVSESRQQTGYEMIKSLLEDWPETYDEPVSFWEFFPIMRLNSGPYANRAYGEPSSYSFVERTYYYKDRPRVCNGLSRISYFEQTNTSLLSKHFKIGEPLGDPAKLDRQGGFSMTFSGEGLKLANLHDKKPIIETPFGLGSMNDIPDRAIWIINGSEVPIIKPTSEADSSDTAKDQDDIPFFSDDIKQFVEIDESDQATSEQEETGTSEDYAEIIDFESNNEGDIIRSAEMSTFYPDNGGVEGNIVDNNTNKEINEDSSGLDNTTALHSSDHNNDQSASDDNSDEGTDASNDSEETEPLPPADNEEPTLTGIAAFLAKKKAL